MIQQPEDPLQKLETEMKNISWGEIAVEPDPQEVQTLDQELPQEWTQFLTPELDPMRQEFTQDELQQHGNAPLELPEGNIDLLVQELLEQTDIDLDELFNHVELPPLKQEPDSDLDLGR